MSTISIYTIQKGDRFGKLEVLDSFKDTKNRRTMFKCVCDCGNIKNASARNLQRGSTTHCGCSRNTSNLGLPDGVAALNALISTYKSNAKRKGYEFNLTDEDMIALFNGNCFFCGEPPTKIFKKKNIKSSYTYNGIDRIDSSKGYTIDNTNSCCTVCNYLKSNKTNEEFLNKVIEIAENHKRKD